MYFFHLALVDFQITLITGPPQLSLGDFEEMFILCLSKWTRESTFSVFPKQGGRNQK